MFLFYMQTFSNSDYMIFCKIQGPVSVQSITEVNKLSHSSIRKKFLILSNSENSRIELSKIGILRSSSIAHRGYCKQCLTPIYMRYNSASTIWINAQTFSFDYEFTSDNDGSISLRTDSSLTFINDVFT